jgi:hypothetical protein
MEPQQLYDTAVNLAVSMIRITTREKVIESTWLPFTILYDEMVKRKEIIPIGESPRKRDYWNETHGSKYRRIFVSKALYVFDLLTLQPIH